LTEQVMFGTAFSQLFCILHLLFGTVSIKHEVWSHVMWWQVIASSASAYKSFLPIISQDNMLQLL